MAMTGRLRTSLPSGVMCSPHSRVSGFSHHQRPARGSSPTVIGRVHGAQPMLGNDSSCITFNGEIYNHRDIRARYAGKYAFQTGSDCEVILALYKDKGIRFLEELNGIFAFALYDEETDDYLIAREQIAMSAAGTALHESVHDSRCTWMFATPARFRFRSR